MIKGKKHFATVKKYAMTRQARVGIVTHVFWRYFSKMYERIAKEYQTKSLTTSTIFSHLGPRNVENRKKIKNIMKWADVAFFEWADINLCLATALPKMCKIITRLHAHEIFYMHDRINWGKVDAVIFVNNAMKKRFIKLYPRFKGIMRVIYGYVDENKFRPIQRKHGYNIGILGSIIPQKRAYELILAFYQAQKKNRKLKLFIGGPVKEHYRAYLIILEELVDKLGLANKVTFEGHIRNPARWLNKIDVIVSNSYHEGFHTALHEGMACGCYPLAHFWDGVDEFLPKENLYITEEELARKILRYFSLAEQTKKAISKKMRDVTIERCNVDKISDEIIDTVEQVYEN